MHIDNVTINFSAPPFLASALLAAMANAGKPEPELASGTPPVAPTPPAQTATATPPRIGEVWPGQGGVYAGLARGEEGQPDQHLILAKAESVSDLNWADAKAWAAAIKADGHEDFSLPTRFESALLYANVRDQLNTEEWHWTSTQYSAGSAWSQDFSNGLQLYDDTSFEGRARAVRRFAA